MAQQLSDAAAFRRVGAFVAAALVTPFAVLEYDIRVAGGLRSAFAIALGIAAVLLVQPRFPPLRYAAGGIVVGVAACLVFVRFVFGVPDMHTFD